MKRHKFSPETVSVKGVKSSARLCGYVHLREMRKRVEKVLVAKVSLYMLDSRSFYEEDADTESESTESGLTWLNLLALIANTRSLL